MLETIGKIKVWKIVLLVAVIFGTSTFLAGFDTVIQPNVSVELAVDQLNDSDEAATALRSYDRFQSHLPTIVWTGVSAFGLLLFWSDLSRLAQIGDSK